MPKAKAKVTGEEPQTAQRIRITDRVCACGAEVKELARRTSCKQCWATEMERIHGIARALDMEMSGMYERIDD